MHLNVRRNPRCEKGETNYYFPSFLLRTRGVVCSSLVCRVETQANYFPLVRWSNHDPTSTTTGKIEEKTRVLGYVRTFVHAFACREARGREKERMRSVWEKVSERKIESGYNFTFFYSIFLFFFSLSLFYLIAEITCLSIKDTSNKDQIDTLISQWYDTIQRCGWQRKPEGTFDPNSHFLLFLYGTLNLNGSRIPSLPPFFFLLDQR